MTYEPQPVDTSKVTLASDINSLTERLSEHAHAVWAKQRIQDGWSYGPTRDDEMKQHPCLVPYDQLSESEKQYDRNAALETLKAIQTLGYAIIPSRNEARSQTELSTDLRESSGHYDELMACVRAAFKTPQELAVLLSVWSSRQSDGLVWRRSPELYQLIGQRFLKLGAAPVAKEVARVALEWTIKGEGNREYTPWGQNVPLRQILGLALARTGNSDDAQKVLLALNEEGAVDQETLGMLARTYKDQAYQLPANDSGERVERLSRALQIYQDAYRRFAGFWTGINVATLERLLNHPEQSATVARKVREDCQADLNVQREQGASGADLYWHLATLGEAAMNLGEFAVAEQHYRAAYAVASKEFGDLNTTRRHLSWLLDWWIAEGSLPTGAEKYLDQWLPLPKVVVFAGHMLDRPGCEKERFPPRLVESVKETLRQWLSDENALIGYSSAACGADLLFQQTIQELGGESHIVLPFDAEDFVKQSVEFAGHEWLTLFQTITAKENTQIVITSPQKMDAGRISYEYANLVLHGLASVRAAELETHLAGLVVWDGRPGIGPGGTASVVRRWHDLGMTVNAVDLANAATRPARTETSSALLPVIRNPQPPAVVFEGSESEVAQTQIMAMLFGDAVNFSKLTEEQVPRFVEHFLGPIAQIVRRYGEANVTRNTWGDGLYLVFKTVQAAGLCALDICEYVKHHVEQKTWVGLGLPEELGVRLALHAGPVFACQDPITGQLNYTGTHVSRAARLEPKTPPGEVYASQAFAALCSENRVSGFACDYVKQLEWAKTYGTFPTFVLRRRPTSAHSID